MESKKYWIIIAIAVAFGMLMELVKNSNFSTNTKGLEADLVQDNFQIQKGRTPWTPATVVINKPISSGFSLPNQNGTGTNVSLAGLAINKNNANAKAKKKDTKKKKKKNQRRPQVGMMTTGDDSTSGLQDANQNQQNPYGGGSAYNAQTAKPGTPNLPVEDKDERIPQTVQEWAQLLLKEPNWKEAQKFIEYYANRKVSSEIFYGVTALMLSDNRQAMQEVGIFCLGSTPSVASFEHLVDVTSSQLGAQTKKSANYYLLSYTQVSHLRHLAAALGKEKEIEMNREAMRLLKMSIESNIKGVATSNEQTQPPPGQSRLPSTQDKKNLQPSQIQRYYTPFLSILQQIAQQSTDASLRQEASQQLSYLQGKLKELSTRQQVAQN